VVRIGVLWLPLCCVGRHRIWHGRWLDLSLRAGPFNTHRPHRTLNQAAPLQLLPPLHRLPSFAPDVAIGSVAEGLLRCAESEQPRASNRGWSDRHNQLVKGSPEP
jgi:hypothetical protein